MNDKLNHALNEISDKHLNEAETYQKHRNPYWFGAIAAVLAIIIAISAIARGQVTPTEPNLEATGHSNTLPSTENSSNPHATEPDDPVSQYGAIDLSALQELSDLIAAPTLPTLVEYPNWNDYNGDWNAFDTAETLWANSQAAQFNQPNGYADSLTDFFRRSIAEFLSGEENGAYSPVNVYLAMAMLAETTGGNSRQQILDLFGVSSIEQLRQQASNMWNAHYNNDGQTTLLLANSLWLDKEYSFHQNTVDRLADHYYASVFSGDLGTDDSNAQLQSWLNTMTGGLLEEQTKDTKLTPDAVFALASTIYFKAGWEAEFPQHLTSDGIFHATAGDMTTTFMRNYVEGFMYHGSNFSAVCLELTGDNGMWIILPDEGTTVSEVLAGEEYLNLTLNPDSWSNCTRALVHITLPKFDVTSKSDLIKGMKNLGLSDIFDYSVSDFTPMTSDSNELSVGQIDHAARVTIDEKGVIAAAYTVIEVTDDSAPPEIIDFVVDRPFLFAVSSQDDLPLFAGVVNEP